MTAYKEAAFMADLMMGYQISQSFQNHMANERFEAFFDDIQYLNEIVDRLRAQLLHIIQSNRHWKRRHEEMQSHPVKRKYSMYEGMLCLQDLKQHWVLYRKAMRELHETKRLCHAAMYDIGKRKSGLRIVS